MEPTLEAIERHKKLVERAAKHYWQRIKGRSWLGYEDLLQAGYIGLVEGLRRYDPATGFKEITYLWPTVYGMIQKEITSHNHTLKVGQRFKNYASKIHNALGNPDMPQDDQAWSEHLGVSVDEIKIMQQYLATGYMSMEYAYDEDGETFSLHDVIAAPDDKFEDVDLMDRIDRACLSDFDRRIVRLRELGYTLTEITGMVPTSGKRSKNMKAISESLRRVRRRMRREEKA